MVLIQPVEQINFKSRQSNLPERTIPTKTVPSISKTGVVIGNIGWLILSVGLLLGAAKAISTIFNKPNQNEQEEVNKEKPANPDKNTYNVVI